MTHLKTVLAGATLLVVAAACDRTPDSATAPTSPSAARGRPTTNVTKAPRMAGGLVIAAAPGDLATNDLTTLTPTQLVQTMVGSGVTISNVQYTGALSAAGTFTGDAAIVGFESGILLSSGDIKDVTGPNTDDGITTIQGTPGDPDLATLSGFDTYDAAVLSFNFVPSGNTVTFQYVFASDEYNEFVNTQYNDVFAFYVNGTNCAVVGSPARPVSINTINNGNPDLPADPVLNPATNPALYRNNDLDDGGGSINTEMDGLTTVLTCTAPVNPGVTNTMKLAIADASDAVLDAVVFIKAGSFVAPNQPPTVTITAPATGSTFAQGASVSFAGSATDPEDGALTGASLVWSSSLDGTLGTGTSISTTTLSVGTHTITLRATDAGGVSATATIQITITAVTGNRPPVPVFTSGPTSSITGQRLDYTFNVTDPDGDAVTCEIDFGEGGGFEPVTAGRCVGGAASHVYTTAGTFTITLRATDAGGLTGTATRTVTITLANRPPVPTLGGPSTGAVGQVLAFTTGATDPDGDAVTCAINWGEGGAFVPLASCNAGATHAFAAPGTYAVVLRAVDARGASNTVALTVTIGGTNRAPVATLSVTPPTGVAPHAVSATTSATDPDGDSPLTCTINWGDGSGEAALASCGAGATHTYSGAGTFVVTLTARDPSNATGTATATVVVTAPQTNTPPEIVNLRTFPEGMAAYPLNGTSCYQREQVCIKYTIRDVDPGDTPFTTTVNWGDGTPTYAPNPIPGQNIPLLAYHRYAATGTYTVTVVATDRRGASSTRTITVRIDP